MVSVSNDVLPSAVPDKQLPGSPARPAAQPLPQPLAVRAEICADQLASSLLTPVERILVYLSLGLSLIGSKRSNHRNDF